MIEWFGSHPVAVGVVTLLLMGSDWTLTVLQQCERAAHSANHYRSYPVDTVEGSPLLQRAVRRARFLHGPHLIAAVLLSSAVAFAVRMIPPGARGVFLGYVWGLFLIVGSTHAGNLIGYVAGRRGIHGQVWIHQRTAYVVQMGRYLALTALLAVLAVISGSPFVSGIALAGGTSSARQLIWMRRVPEVPDPDLAPEGALERAP